MIQIIIWSEGDFESVLLSEDAEGNRIFNNQYSAISEMKDAWLLLLNNKDEWDAIEVALEAVGGMIIVGTYNVDGSQYIWFEQGKAGLNHTLAKYQAQLNDVIDYDDNNEPIGSHPATEAEALNTQVNKIFGWGNRQLEDIII